MLELPGLVYLGTLAFQGVSGWTASAVQLLELQSATSGGFLCFAMWTTWIGTFVFSVFVDGTGGNRRACPEHRANCLPVLCGAPTEKRMHGILLRASKDRDITGN